MDSFSGSGPRSSSPDFESPSERRGGPAEVVIGGWRLLTVPLFLAIVAGSLLVVLFMGPDSSTLVGKSPGSSGAAVPPIVVPTATDDTLLAKARANVAAAVPPPITAPTAVPTPVPTIDPDIRPLVGPVMPRVEDRGPVPARNPGTPDPNPSTEHVIVVDGASGAVLFQRNDYEPVAPASLTKIMTALVGIERGNLHDHVKVDVDASAMPGSSLMGLEPWFDVTFEDLLYGLMLPSGNDAALAIARYIAGTDGKFADLMNEKARWLGLRATHFVVSHGLDTPDHYSCPADMVALSRYAMQYPEFRKIVATRRYPIRESNVSYDLENVNPILGYPGADGVKTGFTDSAGRALVGTAVRDGHRVYVAFMRSENGAWADGSLLLDWAFSSFTWP